MALEKVLLKLPSGKLNSQAPLSNSMSDRGPPVSRRMRAHAQQIRLRMVWSLYTWMVRSKALRSTPHARCWETFSFLHCERLLKDIPDEGVVLFTQDADDVLLVSPQHVSAELPVPRVLN